MKKKVSLLLAVALVLTMLFTFASCSGGMKQGYYTVSEVSMGENSYTDEQLKSLGLDESVYIKVDGGGKGKIAVDGQPFDMTYDDKQMTVNNEPADYKYENDTIIIYYVDYSMSFKYNKDFKPE